MVCSSFSTLSGPLHQISSLVSVHENQRISQMKIQTGFSNSPKILLTSANSLQSSSSSPTPRPAFLQKSVPLAASLAILLFSTPANAGFLSGFRGIESVPGPKLPPIEFLNRFNEENQKKYAEADARFKSSPLLKELLERSRLNKEKNRQEILDKYCLRGAEWGVGDCSTEGMTREEKENFIAALKQKAGVK
ncbi:uncharacterized protein LOC131143721 [Malania oleifera]|uniref:uncharacterized protein LOC131143721 n=1 Tax=Malania oleifera TaxID=397392 RepID=UPI0025AE2471|nr:uncharacterized protein LOC131143721 [Malania oleifera]